MPDTQLPESSVDPVKTYSQRGNYLSITQAVEI